jgi:hypothetical protein
MLKFYCKLSAILFFTTVFLYSCNNGKSGNQFNSKEDSLSFAKDVMQKYGKEGSLLLPEQDTPLKARPLLGKGMEPISWETVVKFKDYYDKDPQLFNLDKQPYKGFSIDTAGYTMLMSNTHIKGLYLRLGRKDDGAYTIMILGTDANGQVLQTKNSLLKTTGDENSNFDQVIPCPTNCPDIDQ